MAGRGLEAVGARDPGVSSVGPRVFARQGDEVQGERSRSGSTCGRRLIRSRGAVCLLPCLVSGDGVRSCGRAASNQP